MTDIETMKAVAYFGICLTQGLVLAMALRRRDWATASGAVSTMMLALVLYARFG